MFPFPATNDLVNQATLVSLQSGLSSPWNKKSWSGTMFPSRTQWCIVTNNNSCFRGRDHYCADCYYHPAGDKSGLELASQAIPRQRQRWRERSLHFPWQAIKCCLEMCNHVDFKIWNVQSWSVVFRIGQLTIEDAALLPGGAGDYKTGFPGSSLGGHHHLLCYHHKIAKLVNTYSLKKKKKNHGVCLLTVKIPKPQPTTKILNQ